MKLVSMLSILVLLAGCSNNPDLTMKIEKAPNEYKMLMGEFVGSLALVTGNPKNATIHATDGEFSCDGISNSGKFTTDMSENKITHIFHLNCSNGTTGELLLKISRVGTGHARGMGTGTLNDGAKVKVLVGDMAPTLSW